MRAWGKSERRRADGEELGRDGGPVDSTCRPPTRGGGGVGLGEGAGSSGEGLDGRPAQAWVTPEELEEGTDGDELGGMAFMGVADGGRKLGRRLAQRAPAPPPYRSTDRRKLGRRRAQRAPAPPPYRSTDRFKI
jgi:hypothetical protein